MSWKDKNIVLFDGVCNFCNASVNFIIDWDRNGKLHFAPLQSEVGKAILEHYGFPSEYRDGLVLSSNGRIRTKSDAAIAIGQLLPFPYSLASVLYVFPRFLRNAAYDFIAANRYRWWGRRDACRMPDPDLAARFVNKLQ